MWYEVAEKKLSTKNYRWIDRQIDIDENAAHRYTKLNNNLFKFRGQMR